MGFREFEVGDCGSGYGVSGRVPLPNSQPPNPQPLTSGATEPVPVENHFRRDGGQTQVNLMRAQQVDLERVRAAEAKKM
jgi:hypothetical protein